VKNNFKKRVVNIKTQNRHIRMFIRQVDAFIQAQKNPAISKSFRESVNLAISQVNGCKLCSFVHAKNALKSGMSKEEVDLLLNGGLENAPKDQLEALLFAQHYADTKGNPDPKLEQKLLKTYGKEKTNDIMASILMMNLTNLHGNTIEALVLRLKGRAVEYSNFWQEIGVTLNFFRIIPIIFYKTIMYKFFSKKRDRLKVKLS